MLRNRAGPFYKILSRFMKKMRSPGSWLPGKRSIVLNLNPFEKAPFLAQNVLIKLVKDNNYDIMFTNS